MTTAKEVCGTYPGATPWMVETPEGESDARTAERLAESAGCDGYTVEGHFYPYRERTMADYRFTCRSGAIVLVSAETAAAAEAEWDADADAEERVTSARLATEEDIAWCEESGHDYR
jgi:hypothetical protein